MDPIEFSISAVITAFAALIFMAVFAISVEIKTDIEAKQQCEKAGILLIDCNNHRNEVTIKN